MAKLYFYYGSMNSSKSAQLIMTHYNFNQQGKKTLVIKSGLDTRDNTISSRALNNKVSIDLLVSPDKEGVIFNYVKEQSDLQFVFVDEVQFLSPSQIEELSLIVDSLNINVICYGLLTDFKGELFLGSRKLIEEADSIREIKNQCAYCSNKANRNMRLFNNTPVFSGEIVQVGAEESYIAICRKCFNNYKGNT